MAIQYDGKYWITSPADARLNPIIGLMTRHGAVLRIQKHCEVS